LKDALSQRNKFNSVGTVATLIYVINVLCVNVNILKFSKNIFLIRAASFLLISRKSLNSNISSSLRYDLVRSLTNPTIFNETYLFCIYFLTIVLTLLFIILVSSL